MFRKLVTVTVLMLPALALAQERHGGLFENADPNKDGMITREEFNAARVEAFAKLDRNSDGFIDSSDRDGEAANQGSGRRHRMHGARMDADSDGKVSKEEFVNGPTQFFDRADTDKSNVLDAKELEAVRAMAKERGREWRKRGTPPAGTTTQ
jgi:Ca2+-binding EF-hand superfamily protein